jgi:8-oxo-dGTP pyrophosphatase MutT (NUDIX family)
LSHSSDRHRRAQVLAARAHSFIPFHPAEIRARLPKGHIQNLRPRDAATLIVYDASANEPRVLMGQRHSAHKFLPDKFVFPGGRVEPRDYTAANRCRGVLADAITAKLSHHIRGTPHRLRAAALAHAAWRETLEETGVVIGGAADCPDESEGATTPPHFGGFALIARAITPPRRIKRFDTRFFAVSAEEISGGMGTRDGEFDSVHWLTLDEARAKDLPIITRTVLDDFAARLAEGSLGDAATPVPFYFTRGACYHRRVI